MAIPLFYVDFNEMVEGDLVLLSVGDSKVDASGATILLREGMQVCMYMDDLDEKGNIDNLVATGFVEKNLQAGWSSHVKWCCRINENGIRSESEILE